MSRAAFRSPHSAYLLVDAKNERVAKWYSSYRAVPLADAPLTLLLPLATIQDALANAGKL